MNFIIFQIRRFFMFLADAFIFPFRKIRELWSDPLRGRSMIFGLPALLVALLGIIAVLIAIGSQSVFLKNYEVAKDVAENEENWAEAIVYMRKIMQFRPNDDTTKWELAKILNSDNRQESSDENRRTAIAILNSLSPEDQPRLPRAHVWRANQYLNMPSRQVSMKLKMEKAEEQLRFALDTDPTNKDAKILLAERILIPKRLYQEALNVYVELFDEYVAYYVKIAELYVAMGKPDSAQPYIEQAIERYTVLLEEDPSNTNYLRRRANAYAMLNEHESAVKSLLDAIEVADKPLSVKQLQAALSRIYLARAMEFSADAQIDAGAQSRFLDFVIKAYQTDPENDAAKTSLTRFGFSNYVDAPRALNAYDPRDNPEDATDESLTVAGTYELLNGDRLLGVRLLELSIQKNPRNHEAMNNLSFSIMDSDLKRSMQLINNAIKIESNKPEYLDTRGNIHMRLGNWPSATNDLEQAEKMLKRLNRQPTIQLYESLVKCYQMQSMVSSAASYQKKVDELRAQEVLQNSSGEND